MQPPAKYGRVFTFGIISLLYIATRIIIFRGFNGTDDLHYAMLAANMLKGKYSPFAQGDIFSARVLLIAWQALLYRIGGINLFTTQAGTMLAVVVACYLTIFKLMPDKNANTVIVGASLFYFNPVLLTSTKGVLPDIYILLAGIAVILLWNKTLQQNTAAKNFRYGLYIGLVITAGMFVKETALVFFLLIICLVFIERTRQASITFLATVLTLVVCGLASASVYYHYTGNALYRLQQIQDSYYYNPCSYDIIPVSYLVARLTYGVWKEFIANGFYPVLFCCAIILYRVIIYKSASLFKYKYIQYFVVLLAISLYFPFSVKGYQPICGDARHFLFLLPLAVCISTSFIVDDIGGRATIKWALISLIFFVLCILATPDKWQWMMWGLFILFFIGQKFIRDKHFNLQKNIVFAIVLWVSMPYYLFYNNSNWFGDMRQLNKQLTGTHYYFPGHDNMMHWKLLHQFNDSIDCYDLDAYPFKVFQLYYEKLDSLNFHPGWFLVNTKYTERSDGFLHTIDSLQQKQYFPKQIIMGDVRAYYIQQPSQLYFVKTTVENDMKVMK